MDKTSQNVFTTTLRCVTGREMTSKKACFVNTNFRLIFPFHVTLGKVISAETSMGKEVFCQNPNLWDIFNAIHEKSKIN